MISFVNSAQAGSATVTLPSGIQVNDIIVLFGYRNTTTAPSLPAGYTAISTQSANSNAFRSCYRVANGSESGTNVTMTNANVVQCAVYRGAYIKGASGSTTNAASTTTNISGLTLNVTNGTSWVVSYCGSRQTTSQSTPAGTTLRGTTQTGTTSMALICDSNGGTATWSSKTSTAGASVTGAGGSVELLAAASASSLSDNFNDNSLAAVWDAGTIGAGSTTSEVNQQIEMAPGASVAGAESYLDAGAFVPKWYMVGDGWFVNLKQLLIAHATDTQQSFQVIANDFNQFYFRVDGSPQQIVAGHQTGGTDTDLVSATYSSSTHAWIRIREASGVIYWDTSPDGLSWTNFTSLAAPWSPASVYIKFQAIANNVASPGVTIWDSLNITPSVSANKSMGFFAAASMQ